MPQDEVKKALELIANIVINIPNSLYQYYKTEAVERIGNRDIDDEREVKKSGRLKLYIIIGA